MRFVFFTDKWPDASNRRALRKGCLIRPLNKEAKLWGALFRSVWPYSSGMPAEAIDRLPPELNSSSQPPARSHTSMTLGAARWLKNEGRSEPPPNSTWLCHTGITRAHVSSFVPDTQKGTLRARGRCFERRHRSFTEPACSASQKFFEEQISRPAGFWDQPSPAERILTNFF
jgi:hypothetical protein